MKRLQQRLVQFWLAAAFSVGVAQAAPSVAITSPAAHASYASPAVVAITATASVDKGAKVSRVSFYRDGVLIGEDTKAPYGVTWSSVPAGSYSLTAVVTDSKNATATSAAVPITVSAPNQSPTVSLTSPSAGASFIAPATVTLTANAGDTDGTVTKVEFYQGATLIGTATSAPYSVTWSAVTAGSYSLTAKATDDRGAVTTSAATGITVVDNQLPTVSLTSPSAGASFLSPAEITLTATAGDADGTVTQVAFYQGATLIGTATSAPYSVTWSAVAAGSYSLTAKATDDRGAVTTSAATGITVADNQLPTVSLTSPSAGASFLSPAEITLTATAGDADGTVTQVAFYQGATLIGTATSAPYSVTWSNVAAGSYSLTATATDELGSQTRSAAVAITVTAASTGAPRILYLHGDHLGTPRVATDAANQVVWRNLPLGEPFGVTPPEEDPDGDGQATVINLRFPGQYFDRETGLSYNYFRDYDPGTGRYVQSDPIGLEGGINTYLYVGANPLSFVDIFGLYKCSCRTTATTEQGGGIAARNPRLRPGETNAAGEPYQVKYFWYSCRCDCPGKSPVDIDVFGGSDDYGKGNQFPHGTSDFLKWPYLPTVKGNFVQTPRWEGGAKSFKVDTEEWFFPNPDLDDIKNGINDQMQEKCPCKKQ